MSIEENKRNALAFLKSMETGTDWSLATEDMRFWIPGKGYINKPHFLKLQASIGTVMKGGVATTVRNVTAEDNRVAVEFDGCADLVNGNQYRNTYHFLYIFRDGKIAEQREHASSSGAAKEAFGDLLEKALG